MDAVLAIGAVQDRRARDIVRHAAETETDVEIELAEHVAPGFEASAGKASAAEVVGRRVTLTY